jgi:hypothetical protein
VEVREVFFGLKCRNSHFVPNSQPSRSHALIASENLKPPSTHAKVLDNVEKLVRLALCAIGRFFCNYDIGINIAMDEMTVNLGVRQCG